MADGSFSDKPTLEDKAREADNIKPVEPAATNAVQKDIAGIINKGFKDFKKKALERNKNNRNTHEYNL